MIEPSGPAHCSAIQDIRPHRLPWIIEQIRALLQATGLPGGDGLNNALDPRGDSVKRLPQTASRGGSEPKERSIQSTRTDLTRPAEPNRLTRLDYLLATLVACIAFVIYLLTLAPGLLMNDSGEFQTLAATFGYTHPTGYPVYLMLCRLAVCIPVGDVAFRANLFSTIMAGATVGGVYLLGRLLTERRGLPVAGGLALAVSPTFWSQAIIAEVYTSGTAFMVLVLLSLLYWQRTRKPGWLFFAGVIGGLSLGVHATVGLMVPAALIFLAMNCRGRLRDWSTAFVGSAVGLAVTFLAFLAVHANNPPSNYFSAVVEPSRSVWGLEEEDLDGPLGRIRFHLSAAQFQSQIFAQPASTVLGQLGAYLDNLDNEFPALWLLAALVGMCRLAADNRSAALLFGVTLVFHLIYDLNFDMGDVQVIYLPTYVVLAVLGVVGLRLFLDVAVYALRRLTGSAGMPCLAESALVLGSLTVIGWPMLSASAWTEENRRAVWVPEGEPPFLVDYSEELRQRLGKVVDELEDDAIVLTDWGFLYPYYYVAHVERGRTSMLFIQDRPGKDQQDLSESALDYMEMESHLHPVYVSTLLPSVIANFETEPVERGGFLFHRILGPKKE